MEKVLAVILMIAALLVGSVMGAVMFPTTEQVVKQVEVVKEVPVVEYVSVPVEVEVEVEVEKDFDAIKQEAVDLCLNEFVEDFDPDRYQEVEVRSVRDDWSLEFTEDEKITKIDRINFRVYDTLLDRRTDYTRSCTIVDEDGEDLVIGLR